jgi:hypothetical protein
MDLKLGISPSEENKLRVSENRAMKEIFGLHKESVKKGWGGKLHKDELSNL